MARSKKGKPYNQGMLVVGITDLLVLGIYMGADAAKGPDEDFLRIRGLSGPLDEEPDEPVLQDEVLLDKSGYTSEGSSSNERFEVPWTSTTELSITLDWNDDYGNNDEFEMVLSLEGEEVDRTSGTSGTLTIDQDGPGQGNYTVTITAVDCPGQFTSSQFDRDTGNDWSIEVKAVHEVVP